MSYIKKYENAVDEIASLIAPNVGEYIQERIAWQTDGYEFCDHLSGDDYYEFAERVRAKALQLLYTQITEYIRLELDNIIE